MDQNEILVATFFKKYGLRAEKIPESLLNGIKSPDFRLFNKDDLVLFGEVKTLEPDVRLRKELDITGPFQSAEVSESIYNRIANDIKYASKQFVAQNPDHEYPNVLIFVNKRDCDLSDLRTVLEGVNVAGTISIHVIGADLRARLAEAVKQIEAYVWLESNEPDRVIFNTLSTISILEMACNAFGTSADALPPLPPIVDIS